MTKGEAIIELMRDSRTATNSYTSYKRVQRACHVLQLDAASEEKVMRWLEYIDTRTGELRQHIRDQALGGTNHGKALGGTSHY